MHALRWTVLCSASGRHPLLTPRRLVLRRADAGGQAGERVRRLPEANVGRIRTGNVCLRSLQKQDTTVTRTRTTRGQRKRSIRPELDSI